MKKLMEFGINNSFFSALLNPYKFYLYYKRKKYISKYKEKFLSLGLGVSINNTNFGKYVHLGDNVSLNNVKIGDHTYVNSRSYIVHSKIGKFCSIGQNVTLGLGNHPTNLISTHPAFYSKIKPFKTFADNNYFNEYKEISIENDVWISSNVIIIGGVKIGTGSLIAAGSIVTKDVKPFEVVGGIPAKHIKYRIDISIIDKILESNWWDKDENWFKEHFDLFLSEDRFLEYFDSQNNSL